MEIFIIWIALSMLAAFIASNKGRNGFAFGLLAFFLSPLIGLTAAVVAKRNVAAVEQQQVQSGEMKKCPFCAEVIKRDAHVCRYCNRDLPEVVEGAGIVANHWTE